MIVIVFGLPAAGKTFVGKILEKDFKFYLHDADVDLPNDMRLALSKNVQVSDEMRDRFFENILENLEVLQKKYSKIVVAQTFIKEKYREWMRKKNPEALFLLVDTPDQIREKRLRQRTEYPLDLTYSRQMVTNFDEPKIEHATIDNSVDGEEYIIKQIEKFLINQNER